MGFFYHNNSDKIGKRIHVPKKYDHDDEGGWSGEKEWQERNAQTDKGFQHAFKQCITIQQVIRENIQFQLNDAFRRFKLKNKLYLLSKFYNKQLVIPVDRNKDWGEMEQNFGFKFIANYRSLRWTTEASDGIGSIDDENIEYFASKFYNQLDQKQTLRTGEIVKDKDAIRIKCSIKRTPNPKPETIVFGIMLGQEKVEHRQNYIRPTFLTDRVLPYINRDSYKTPLDFCFTWGRHIIGMAVMMGATDTPFSLTPVEVQKMLEEISERAGNTTPDELIKERVYPFSEGSKELLNECEKKLEAYPAPELMIFMLENPSISPDFLKNPEVKILISQIELWIENGLVIDRVSEIYCVLLNHKKDPIEALKTTLRIISNIYGGKNKKPWWFKENFSIAEVFHNDAEELTEENNELIIPLNDEGTALIEEISETADFCYQDTLNLYKKGGFKLKSECGLSQTQAIIATCKIARMYGIENIERAKKILNHLIFLLNSVKEEERKNALKLFLEHLERFKPANPLEAKMEGDASMEYPGINNMLSILKGEDIARTQDKDFTNLSVQDLQVAQSLLTGDVIDRAALPNPLFKGSQVQNLMLEQKILRAFPVSESKNELAQSPSANPINESIQYKILNFYEQMRTEIGHIDIKIITAYFNLFAQKFPDPFMPPKGLLKAIKVIANMHYPEDMDYIFQKPSERKPNKVSKKEERIIALVTVVDAYLLGIFPQEKFEQLLALFHISWEGRDDLLIQLQAADNEYKEYLDSDKGKLEFDLQCHVYDNQDEKDQEQRPVLHYRILQERYVKISDEICSKDKFHNRKQNLLLNRIKELQNKTFYLYYLLRKGLIDIETLKTLCNRSLEKILKFKEYLEEPIPEPVPGIDNSEPHDAFTYQYNRIDGLNIQELEKLFLDGIIKTEEFEALFINASDCIEDIDEIFEICEWAISISTNSFNSDIFKNAKLLKKIIEFLTKQKAILSKYPQLKTLSAILDKYLDFYIKLFHLYNFSESTDTKNLLSETETNTPAQNATDISLRLIHFIVSYQAFLSNLQTAEQKELSTEVNLEKSIVITHDTALALAQVDQAGYAEVLETAAANIQKIILQADEPARQSLLKLRKTKLGLLPVGGKIHFLHPIDEQKFKLLSNLLGLNQTAFALAEAGKSIILPPTLTPEELQLLIKVLSEYGLIETDKPELQITMAGRLDNTRAAVLGSATLLATETQTEYSAEAFKTNQNQVTGTRMLVYDAGAENQALPFCSDYKGRTDILGRRSLKDIDNYQLLGTVLVHDQYGGPFGKFAKWFIGEYKTILKKYGLLDVLECEWVLIDQKKHTNEAAEKHYQKVKQCTDAWFAHHDKIDLNIQKEGTKNVPGIIYDVRNLLEGLKQKVAQKQQELYTKNDSCQDAEEALKLERSKTAK